MTRHDTPEVFRLAFFIGMEDKQRDIYHNIWADGQTPMADLAYRAGWHFYPIRRHQQEPGVHHG